MHAVMHSSDVAPVETARPKDKTAPYLTTTLYDLIAALQDITNQDDAVVVATMRHLLKSGRLTWHSGLAVPIH